MKEKIEKLNNIKFDEEERKLNWEDITFEMELLKSEEINLDYILKLIFEKNKIYKDKEKLMDDIKRLIKSSIEHRKKEELIIEFINNTNIDEFKNEMEIIDEFFEFAKSKFEKEQEEMLQN